MISYYDLVLGLMPLVFVIGVGALTGVGAELEIALAIAALATASIIGHALFIRNPTDTGNDDRSVPPAAE